MEATIGQMSEAWEDILLEMDSKLKTLAEEKYVRYSIWYMVPVFLSPSNVIVLDLKELVLTMTWY